MSELSPSLAKLLGLTRASGRHLIRSVEELAGASGSHALRRAWEVIGLSAILLVDNKPTVYFKEVNHYRESDLKRYQRFVWNQGIATLLVVCTPTEVLAFSGLAIPADDESQLSDGGRMVEQLNRVNDALAIERLVYRIETGRIYEDHSPSFDREQAIDQYLLRNLNATAAALYDIDRRLSLSRIHNLLGRTIFVCYLVDREIIDSDFFAAVGAANTTNLLSLVSDGSVDQLYSLFEKLQGMFNGSLFEEELDDEQARITVRHLKVLASFLRGDDVGSKQKSLGFWAYDFNFIPTETISAIYEEFLGIEQELAASPTATLKRTSGAYYTPKHLAELVLDTAIQPNRDLLKMRVLDPACGSGIFLVSIFNRMAEQWRSENPNRYSVTRWRALVDLLQNKLFGIDSNETACRITCFSLYLALLDQFQPRDIHELAENGRLLPPLLLRRNEKPGDESRPIICRNFFDPDLPNGLDQFDLVVGNPPWVGRNQPSDPVADAWYRDNVEQKMPSRQIAHAFMWKAPRHIADDGLICLVLPSKVFLNRTDEFQQKWFEHHSVEEVLQLADLSFILFETASCPACIVRYGIADPSVDSYDIDYISPQASRSDPRRGVVVITPQDRQRLASRDIIRFAKRDEAPSLWKMYLRGTPRDVRLLGRLMDYPRLESLVGSAAQPKRFWSGQGIQPDAKGNTLKPDSNNKPMYPWWKEDHLFVEAQRNIGFVLNESECAEIGKPYEQYYRVRHPMLFKSPLILVSQGFSKVAFCDFNVLFQDSLQSIAGAEVDRPLLILLCAFLRSRLADYFLFHTAANWGTERDKVQKYELLQLPFFPPDHELAPPNAVAILESVNTVFNQAAQRLTADDTLINREEIIRSADDALEPLIFAYFDCDEHERAIVLDTCRTVEPSATPGSLDAYIPTLSTPDAQQRLDYSKVLTGVMNGWAKRSVWKVSAKSVTSPSTGFGVVELTKSRIPTEASDDEADDRLVETLKLLQKSLNRENGFRSYMRGLTYFDGADKVYLLKPLLLRCWTHTAALNDADLLAAAILNADRKP